MTCSTTQQPEIYISICHTNKLKTKLLLRMQRKSRSKVARVRLSTCVSANLTPAVSFSNRYFHLRNSVFTHGKGKLVGTGWSGLVLNGTRRLGAGHGMRPTFHAALRHNVLKEQLGFLFLRSVD